jgi:hypothetical protein
MFGPPVSQGRGPNGPIAAPSSVWIVAEEARNAVELVKIDESIE